MMIDSTELRERCAEGLSQAAGAIQTSNAFIGLDGFIDKIVHVVDTRQSATEFVRLNTISDFAKRLAAAAGHSTNIELVPQMTKLGGNGPIMANALATLGYNVTYLGALGYPMMDPVFKPLADTADVYSVSDAGVTNALEFDDGKLMLSSNIELNEVNWKNIESRFGLEKLKSKLAGAHLIGFVNWTMIPFMSEVWEHLLKSVCPNLPSEERRVLFIDLADPEKRLNEDIRHALDLIRKFGDYFEVILGLNEKECYEVADALGIAVQEKTPKGLARLAEEMNHRIGVHTLVIHPVSYALATSEGSTVVVKGPVVRNPKITTGAGDHFNAGFCLGKTLGLSNDLCVQAGVTTSGFYVRNARSPVPSDLVNMLRNWPVN